jgi:hypothetical protein
MVYPLSETRRGMQVRNRCVKSETVVLSDPNAGRGGLPPRPARSLQVYMEINGAQKGQGPGNIGVHMQVQDLGTRQTERHGRGNPIFEFDDLEAPALLDFIAFHGKLSTWLVGETIGTPS